MARIIYDCYLYNIDGLITITNANTDSYTEVIEESLTNPPLKIRFPKISEDDLEKLCRYWFEHHNENNPQSGVSPTDGARMLRGELLGWRLIGVDFTPELGAWGCCVNEQQALQAISENRDYEGIMVRFSDNIELELEIDYADGLPVRRYYCVIGDSSSEFATEVTEYLGKRKVRKIEYDEGMDNKKNDKWLCHITEY